MPFCLQCGREFSEGDEFCRKCGFELRPKAMQRRQAGKRTKRVLSLGLKYGLPVVFLVVILLYPSVFVGFFMDLMGIPLEAMSEEEVMADPDGALETCDRATISQLRDSCYMNVASILADKQATRAVGVCSSVEDDSMRYSCYGEVALLSYEADAESAERACGAIERVDRRDECFRSVFLRREPILENPSLSLDICSELSDKDECAFNVANTIRSENPSMAREACGEIESTGFRDECYSTVARAMKGIDPTEAVKACFEIENEYTQYDCLSEVWIGLPDVVVAMPDQSIGLCEAAQVKRDSCLWEVALALRTTNPPKAVAACEKVGDVFERDSCLGETWYRVPSRVASDPDESMRICAEVSPDRRDECYWNVASSLYMTNRARALEACENIVDPATKEGCIYSYGS
ncbi:MAG: hypothetical protein ACE5IB_06575 [Candidatus Geothermarchaeales archaeon]